jgi:hypothetical protein
MGANRCDVWRSALAGWLGETQQAALSAVQALASRELADRLERGIGWRLRGTPLARTGSGVPWAVGANAIEMVAGRRG